jgi:hypothetical protein
LALPHSSLGLAQRGLRGGLLGGLSAGGGLEHAGHLALQLGAPRRQGEHLRIDGQIEHRKP